MGSVFLAAVQVGGYVSPLKTIPDLLVLLLWARLLTWVDKDSPAAHLPREGLNVAFLGGLILGFALFFFLPTFLIAFPVLLFVMVAEIGAHLIIRQQKAGLAHLKVQFNDWIHSFGRAKKVKELPNQVQIMGKAGALVPPPDAEAPERPAYDALQNALLEPLRKNSEQIDLAPSANGSVLKYMVDGVFYQGLTLDRGL